MDPGILVPPKGYGGHERLVYMFAVEYRRLGHTVHLLVTSGSAVEGCTIHTFGNEGFPPKRKDALMAIPVAWKFLWQHRNQFDLIHNFGRLAYLMPVLNHRVKKIMTYGREITAGNISMINKLPNKHLVFTGCSNNLISRVPLTGRWQTVYNAIDFSKFQLTENLPPDAPLIFLGRIEKVKGCHMAIEVAKATSNKLIIAGNISSLEDEAAYFKTEVEPNIDGEQIKYIGPVNDTQKDEWLGKSKALLFPIDWEEPFGIVMIEAIACGTPVIAYNRGAVDEVIDEGITGFKVNTKSQMADAIQKIHLIKRAICKQTAEHRFDISVITRQYLSLFDYQ